jgi:hypothetical protein
MRQRKGQNREQIAAEWRRTPHSPASYKIRDLSKQGRILCHSLPENQYFQLWLAVEQSAVRIAISRAGAAISDLRMMSSGWSFKDKNANR